MNNGYRIPILAVLLFLAAGVCAVSAVSLSVGSVTLANLDEQKDIALSLDTGGMTNPMAGYIITFAIGNPAVAKIANVKYPVWAETDFRLSSFSDSTGTMKVADVRGAGGTTPSLGSVTVQGKTFDSQTIITVTVNELDDTGGNLVPVASASGNIWVAKATGSISVTSTTPVAGASIYVDGVFKGTTGSTPLIISGLTPKTYEVKATYTGYADWVQPVVVESGKATSVSIAMQLPVTIKVTTTPGVCDVWITFPSGSEVNVGKTSISTPGTATFTGNLYPPGRYTVRVSKTGYLGKSLGPRSLSPGATSTFTFSLSLATNVEEPFPGIHVDAKGVDGTPIEGARVVLDGVLTEDTTPATIELNAGLHRITVTLEGYMTPDPWEFTITDNHVKQYHTFTLVKTSPSKSCLWEGVHTMTPMTLLNPVTGVTLAVTKITSDERTATDTGSGGARYSPDAIFDKVVPSPDFQLRAERSGSGNGRVYQISVKATNGNGVTTTGFVTVCVPMDQSVPKCTGGDPNKYIQKDQCCCIDSGQKYDATTKN